MTETLSASNETPINMPADEGSSYMMFESPCEEGRAKMEDRDCLVLHCARLSSFTENPYCVDVIYEIFKRRRSP